MSFVQKQYIVPLIFTLIVLIIIFVRNESVFFSWIKDHWFFRRTKRNILSSVLYFSGFFLIGLALLDLRGPEEYVEGKVSDQKTIIMIDSSASMMAEDVRPNRFEKAIVLAKHYVRKAVGQQISVTVFSDLQKRIVPFTNDVDLVDARLNALKDMKLRHGGTSLSYSIKEVLQYFKDSSSEVNGNILIFTDAEETDGGIDLEIPKDITVGVVGIGTAKGATVPVRDMNGNFKGNKKFQGEVVISKLDEAFLKKLGNKIKNYRYWIAGSYSLPTEQIISFFSRIHQIKESENSFRVRPVLQNYLLIPGAILLALSFLLKNMRTFIYVGMLTLVLDASAQVGGRQDLSKQKKKEPVKSASTIALEEKFAKGEISLNEKRLLANQLLKEGFPKQAGALYGEILGENVTEDNKSDYFNYGAAQFKSKNIAGGFNTYKKLYDHLEKNPSNDEQMFKSVKDNMLKAIQGAAGKSGNKDDDDNDEKNDQQQKQSGGKGKKDKDDNKKKNDDQKGDDQQNQKDKQDQNKQNQKDKNDQKKKKQQSNKPVDKKKMPAILKQLVSDDNKIQKKMIDTGTTARKTREKRDW